MSAEGFLYLLMGSDYSICEENLKLRIPNIQRCTGIIRAIPLPIIFVIDIISLYAVYLLVSVPELSQYI
jgi:hypothetical protein